LLALHLDLEEDMMMMTLVWMWTGVAIQSSSIILAPSSSLHPHHNPFRQKFPKAIENIPHQESLTMIGNMYTRSADLNKFNRKNLISNEMNGT
jgi:hypothetical protein